MEITIDNKDGNIPLKIKNSQESDNFVLLEIDCEQVKVEIEEIKLALKKISIK